MSRLDGACAYCRFVQRSETQAALECHHRSPLVTGGMMSNVVTVWPEVKPSDVCGDFKHASGGPLLPIDGPPQIPAVEAPF